MDIARPSRHRTSRFKTPVVVTLGAAFAALPITGLYLLWSFCMAQVPAANEWAGLIKIGLTLVIALVGGGMTVGLTFLFATLLWWRS